MTIVFITVTTIHLVIATLATLNSTFEAERAGLRINDVAVIMLVSAAWPVITCGLLVTWAARKLFPPRREFRSAAR